MKQPHSYTVRELGVLLAAIDNDILGYDSLFQHALFGVVTSPSEQTRGFNFKVTNLLLMTIHCAETILFLDFIIL